MRKYEVYLKEKMKEIVAEVEKEIPEVEYLDVHYYRTSNVVIIKTSVGDVSTETVFRNFEKGE